MNHADKANVATPPTWVHKNPTFVLITSHDGQPAMVFPAALMVSATGIISSCRHPVVNTRSKRSITAPAIIVMSEFTGPHHNGNLSTTSGCHP